MNDGAPAGVAERAGSSMSRPSCPARTTGDTRGASGHLYSYTRRVDGRTLRSIRRHDAVHSTWLPEARGACSSVATCRRAMTEARLARRYPGQLLAARDGQNLFDPDRAHIRRGANWQRGRNRQDRSDPRAPASSRSSSSASTTAGARKHPTEFTPTPGGRRARRPLREVRRHGIRRRSSCVITRFVATPTGGASADLRSAARDAVHRTDLSCGVRLLVMSPSVWWIVPRCSDRPENSARSRAANLADADRGKVRERQATRKLCEVLQASAGTTSAELVRCVEDRHGDHSERAGRAAYPTH